MKIRQRGSPHRDRDGRYEKSTSMKLFMEGAEHRMGIFVDLAFTRGRQDRERESKVDKIRKKVSSTTLRPTTGDYTDIVLSLNQTLGDFSKTLGKSKGPKCNLTIAILTETVLS